MGGFEIRHLPLFLSLSVESYGRVQGSPILSHRASAFIDPSVLTWEYLLSLRPDALLSI